VLTDRRHGQQHAGKPAIAVPLGICCGAGDENRTRMTSLEVSLGPPLDVCPRAETGSRVTAADSSRPMLVARLWAGARQCSILNPTRLPSLPTGRSSMFISHRAAAIRRMTTDHEPWRTATNETKTETAGDTTGGIDAVGGRLVPGARSLTPCLQSGRAGPSSCSRVVRRGKPQAAMLTAAPVAVHQWGLVGPASCRGPRDLDSDERLLARPPGLTFTRAHVWMRTVRCLAWVGAYKP
jgi:hypothetical protein